MSSRARGAVAIDQSYDKVRGLDVVGLGALNVDLIAKPRPGEDDQPVEDDEVLSTSREILGRVRRERVEVVPCHGGSAYNAMAMLAQLRTGLRLGMIGVSAPASYGVTESHADRLRELDIADLTRRSSHRPGLCCALPSPHGRKLWTAPESNLEIIDHLDSNEQLRAVMAEARVLHVTSLLDRPHHPYSTDVVDAVARFVRVARADNPSLIFSFDPGHLWVGNLARDGLRQLYALADVVYANNREYAALTSGGDTESSVQVRSLRHLCPASTLVVLKSLREIVIQHAGGFDLARIPRREEVVAVDPTGAGDAVAAGVLAALGERRSLAEGCDLGLRLAVRRVADYGDRGHVNLRDSLGPLWRHDPTPTSLPPTLASPLVPMAANPGAEPSLPSADPGGHPAVQVNVNVWNPAQMTAVADDLTLMMARLRSSREPVEEDVWLALTEAKRAADSHDEGRLASWLRRLGQRGADLAAKVSATVVERMILREAGL